MISGSYTQQECIDAVRVQHPDANGFTRDEPCHPKCNCFAQIGMTAWSPSTGSHSCVFGDKRK